MRLLSTATSEIMLLLMALVYTYRISAHFCIALMMQFVLRYDALLAISVFLKGVSWYEKHSRTGIRNHLLLNDISWVGLLTSLGLQRLPLYDEKSWNTSFLKNPCSFKFFIKNLVSISRPCFFKWLNMFLLRN